MTFRMSHISDNLFFVFEIYLYMYHSFCARRQLGNKAKGKKHVNLNCREPCVSFLPFISVFLADLLLASCNCVDCVSLRMSQCASFANGH